MLIKYRINEFMFRRIKNSYKNNHGWFIMFYKLGNELKDVDGNSKVIMTNLL
jgi:hypothetical protein